jgi:PST family polysaccharide transporter
MSISSYRLIFKSTALIGSAQIINIFAGIVRTKALALLLGPAGMGLVGLYSTATGLIGTITGMGIGSSGVRQIAEAAGAKDNNKIACTIIALRRASLVSGALGMLVVLVLCVPLTRLTFGDRQYTWGMALMSLTLLFGGISAGQLALLQGLRQIKELASTQALAACFGTIASIGVVYFLRENGIAPYLVAVSAFSILTSWWYARRIRVKPVRMSLQETWRESKGLLGLGSAFMVSALFTAGVAYASRVFILHTLGKDAVGLYQATWTLSTLYVSFVLNAMATDFYPRLTAEANDNDAVNRMVNEQTEIGLLIAIPGVLATITLAPWVLSVFYSGEFISATGIIRWQIVGIAFRVVSWPLGFVQLAKGKGTIFLLTEIAANALHIALLLVGIRLFGLDGVGISFAFLYIFYTVGMLFVCRWLSGFEWSRQAKSILISSFAAVSMVFIAMHILPEAWALACGIGLTAISTILCIKGLRKLLNVKLWSLLRTKIFNR